jgi:hypothetical protein
MGAAIVVEEFTGVGTNGGEPAPPVTTTAVLAVAGAAVTLMDIGGSESNRVEFGALSVTMTRYEKVPVAPVLNVHVVVVEFEAIAEQAVMTAPDVTL